MLKPRGKTQFLYFWQQELLLISSTAMRSMLSSSAWLWNLIHIMPDKPWQPYRVGTPSTRHNWVEPDCCGLASVTHVTHLANALTIIPSKIINPQLVTDESRLNNRRILVNWVSPNHWGNGFRYGNVSFALDWRTLIIGKKFYWVEVMPYSTPACRILITEKNYNGDPDMIPYDPKTGDGPWWWEEASDKHWRNGDHCLEFMLEFEISIEHCAAISFVNHHENYCCIDRNTCRDMGMGAQLAAFRLLAGIISQDVNVSEAPLNLDDLRGGWWLIAGGMPREGYAGAFGVSENDAAAPALARSALHAIWRRSTGEYSALAKIFASKEALESNVKALIKAKFPEFQFEI
jgi:hypothetical protein